MGLEPGVLPEHQTKIQAAARDGNFFIFIRPTEPDSLELIRMGYACKSTDVKDKSSNWGPLAGFVPCNSALSKKPAFGTLHGRRPVANGIAEPMHLVLDKPLLESMKARGKVEHVQPQEGTITLQGTPASVSTQATYAPSRVAQTRGSFADLGVYRPAGKVPEAQCRNVYFFLDESRRLWCFDKPAPGVTAVVLHPVWVWSYKGRPVTGDYDIWALVPHVTRLHSFADFGQIEFAPDQHGGSAAPKYVQRVITELNTRCNHSGGPVFLHGAEAQNLAFAQGMDPRIVMIAPGTAPPRMVRRSQLAKVLADLENCGYLVVLNRQWGAARPQLGGKALPEDLIGADRLLRALLRVVSGRRRAGGATTGQYLRAAARAEQARLKFEESRALDTARREISEWHSELEELRANLDVLDWDLPGGGVRPDELPPGYHHARVHAKEMQRQLSDRITAAMIGKGQTDPQVMQSIADECEALYQVVYKSWTGLDPAPKWPRRLAPVAHPGVVAPSSTPTPSAPVRYGALPPLTQ